MFTAVNDTIDETCDSVEMLEKMSYKTFEYYMESRIVELTTTEFKPALFKNYPLCSLWGPLEVLRNIATQLLALHFLKETILGHALRQDCSAIAEIRTTVAKTAPQPRPMGTAQLRNEMTTIITDTFRDFLAQIVVDTSSRISEASVTFARR